MFPVSFTETKYLGFPQVQIPTTATLVPSKSRLQSAHLEGAHERLVHTHHGPGIIKLSAVVGSREQSDKLPLGEKFITIFYNLWADMKEAVLHFNRTSQQKGRSVALLIQVALRSNKLTWRANSCLKEINVSVHLKFASIIWAFLLKYISFTLFHFSLNMLT